MSDLQELERRIKDELSATEERRRGQDDPQRRSIIDFQQRHEYYTTIADHVLYTLIQPRMHKIAEYFKHAHVPGRNDAGNDRCVLHLRPTLRFPATAKFEFMVRRDAQCETLMVLSNFEILPIFFTFEGHARLTLPLGRVNDDTLAGWLNERLVDFVRTYLRVDAADQYDTRNLAIDPVCGLQINPLYAAAQSEFDGRTYFFCREDCLKKFVRSRDNTWPAWTCPSLPIPHPFLPGGYEMVNPQVATFSRSSGIVHA
jgi:YHS domain-containing protein